MLFQPVCKKFGLDTKEMTDCLTSKLDQLFISAGVQQPNGVKNQIQKVVQVVALQGNKDEERLDQRKKSSKIYAELGLLNNSTDSPQKVATASSSQQGESEAAEQNTIAYHRAQFNLFKSEQMDCFTEGPRMGYLRKENGEQMNNIEFCNAVDELTKMYIQQFQEQNVSSITTTTSERTSLLETAGHCLAVLMGRILGDWYVTNDILNAKQYETWTKHIFAISCFGALMVTLDLLLIKKGDSDFTSRI